MKTLDELTAELAQRINEIASDYTHGKPCTQDFVREGLRIVQADRSIFLRDEDLERISDEIWQWETETSPSDSQIARRILQDIWANQDHNAHNRALFERYAVKASSVADFMMRYYKPDRYTLRTKATGWSDTYASDLLASYEADFAEKGWVIISHYDSMTGNIVALMSLTPAGEG